MAKQFVKYKLNDDGTIPSFIEHGGFFYHNDDKDMTGLTIDNPVLPEGVEIISRTELEDRAVDYYKDSSGVYQYDEDGNKYSKAKVLAKVAALLERLNMSDLA